MTDLALKTDEQLDEILWELRSELRMNEYNDSPSSYKSTKKQLEESILQVQTERDRRGTL